MAKKELTDIERLEGKLLSDTREPSRRDKIISLCFKLGPFKDQILIEPEADIIIHHSGYVIVNGFKDLELANKIRAMLKKSAIKTNGL